MAASRQSLLIVAHLLPGILAAALPAAAQTLPPRIDEPRAQVVEFGEHRPQEPRQIAVVGDVERPGVYESSARRLSAEAVLTAAGSNAPPGYYFTRYHRGLRKVETRVWSAGTVEVASGDILVVPAAEPRTRALKKDLVHVAVIGLGPNPVVIRIPDSDRTLAGLFSRLHQSSDAVAGATVNGARSSELLQNGDVIAVSSHLIDRAALQTCETILPVRSLDSVDEQSKSVTAWSPPELPLYPAPPRVEAGLPQTAFAQELPVEPDGDDQLHAGAEEPARRTAESVSLSLVEPVSGEAKRTSSFLATKGIDAERPSTTSAPSPGSDNAQIRSLVILLALGTLGLGVALLWLASERRLRNAPILEPVELELEPAPQEENDTDDLAELIRGELPVVDEPVVLPARVALHGQAVGQKRLVVHPPQGLAGPHFGESKPPQPTAASPSESAPVPGSPAARPASPVRSPKDTEGLLDRVLLAMQREGRR